ncbi:MAG: hypothetical protein OXF20_05730 [Gammaproteobacteria bacterium]|nr:hypothetical protein [Gammaproteobacteria bacterium]
MSWLDYFERNDRFTALVYACIEARFGIEHLIFEEIVISTGANLSKEDYKKCLANPTKLYKMLRTISSEYEKLQEFTQIIVGISHELPNILRWEPRKLIKSWGKISKYLHWYGSESETTDLSGWRKDVGRKVRKEIEPIWNKITSGYSGLMHPDHMHPRILELWNQFKIDDINTETTKIRMQVLQPLLQMDRGETVFLQENRT